MNTIFSPGKPHVGLGCFQSIFIFVNYELAFPTKAKRELESSLQNCIIGYYYLETDLDINVAFISIAYLLFSIKNNVTRTRNLGRNVWKLPVKIAMRRTRQ